MQADQFEHVEATLDDREIDPAEAYPAIDQVMKEDWDDPAVDLYDDYERRRSTATDDAEASDSRQVIKE